MPRRQRDHRAEYRRSLARARELGFPSQRERRQAHRQVRSRADLEALPARAREVREDSLRAVSLMRAQALSLDEAATLAGTTPEAVKFWARDAVTSKGEVRRADRMLRPMLIYSDGDLVSVDVRGSRVASTVGRYHAAVGTYLATGDTSELEKFRGKKVAGRVLDTDPDVIDELARRGSMSWASLYVAVS